MRTPSPLITELTAKSAAYREARVRLYADLKRTVDAQLSAMDDEVENLVVRAKAANEKVATIARAITPEPSTPNRPKVYEILKRHADILLSIQNAAPEPTGPYSWMWDKAPGKDKKTGYQNYGWVLKVDYTQYPEPHTRAGWNSYRMEWVDIQNEWRFFARRSARTLHREYAFEDDRYMTDTPDYANDLETDRFTTDRAKAKQRFYNRDATEWMNANPAPSGAPADWVHPESVDTTESTPEAVDSQPDSRDNGTTEKPSREERQAAFDNKATTDPDEGYDASEYEDWELDA